MVDKYQKLRRSPLFIGGDVVNTHANELKNCLLKIIDEMALSSDIFNLSGKPAFCRKSKFNFSTLIQFILSFGSNSLGHEIGEFLNIGKGFQLCQHLSNKEKNSVTLP